MIKQKGMTLIELMIVVAIIGIISAIAYPSYQQYVQQSRRTVAQGNLLELAQWMERQYTANGEYPNPAASVTLPILVSPKAGGRVDYNLTLLNVTQNTFTLEAVAVSPQDEDECGDLRVNHIGTTTAIVSGGAPTDCWRY